MATTLAQPQPSTSESVTRSIGANPVVPILPEVPEVAQAPDAVVPVAEVQEEAYALFLARGAEHGHDLEDWLAAEAIVRNRRHHPRPGGES